MKHNMSRFANEEEQKQVALIILRSVHYLQTGKNKLASFLRGSHSKIIKDKDLDRKAGYGALLWHDIPTIRGFINQLEEMGFIKPYYVQTGLYSYPILILTEAGKKSLEEKLKIPLQIRKETKLITIRDSEKETFSLFKQGCKPNEIAKRRGLAVSTIFGHLNKLVSIGEISAKQCVSDEVIMKILQAKQQVQNKSSLKELKQVLPEKITYEEIRIVLSDKLLYHEKRKNYCGWERI